MNRDVRKAASYLILDITWERDYFIYIARLGIEEQGLQVPIESVHGLDDPAALVDSS